MPIWSNEITSYENILAPRGRSGCLGKLDGSSGQQNVFLSSYDSLDIGAERLIIVQGDAALKILITPYGVKPLSYAKLCGFRCGAEVLECGVLSFKQSTNDFSYSHRNALRHARDNTIAHHVSEIMSKIHLFLLLANPYLVIFVPENLSQQRMVSKIKSSSTLLRSALCYAFAVVTVAVNNLPPALLNQLS